MSVQKLRENLGGNFFKESHLIFARWNLVYVILSQIPYHSPIFVSVAMLTNNAEVGNNAHNESSEVVRGKCVRVANHGPEKRQDSDLFVIVRDEYKNKEFLL